MAMQAERDSPSTLADIIDRILDKGLVLNADIAVSVVGVELLGIKIRASLASFETAARYGLEFPLGTKMETYAWQEAMIGKETCPHCAKRVPVATLLEEGCPWCGWLSAKAKKEKTLPSGNGHQPQEIPLEAP
ncbi:MAG: gas vesicle protein [Chloroflexi bacterium]|nr:gas vesicle protein [Chloroflexota bacterium]